MSYARFAAMIAVSTIVMFGLMYLNTYATDHVFFSQTRAWMALVMGATMTAIMLLFMWRMYDNKTWPAAGFVDTEIRCLTELESGNAKKEVQPRVQA